MGPFACLLPDGLSRWPSAPAFLRAGSPVQVKGGAPPSRAPARGPAWSLAPRRGQNACGWLAARSTVPAEAPLSTGPKAPPDRPLPGGGPGPASRSLAKRSAVPPAQFPLHKATSGDCACPAWAATKARRREVGTPPGRTAARAQTKPPRTPWSPALRPSGAPRASLPACVAPRPPRGSRRPTKGQDSSRTLLGAARTPRGPGVRPPLLAPGHGRRGTHGPRCPQPGRRPPHSPRHGRARAPPPSPRPGRLHRSAPGGGAERAQVTMTKQSPAPAVSK